MTTMWVELLILTAVGILLVVAVHGFRTVDKRIARRLSDLVSDLNSNDTLTKSTRQLGLVELVPSITALSYGELFEDATDVTVLMNDGNQWIRNNLPWLRRRHVDNRAFKTTIILVHPASPYLSILARKQQTNESVLVSKIQRTAQIVYRDMGPTVPCLGHFLVSAYSLVISEDTAVYVPYLTSRSRGTVPGLVFKRTQHAGFFDMLRADLDALRVDCRPIGDRPESTWRKGQPDLKGFSWSAGLRVVNGP